MITTLVSYLSHSQVWGLQYGKDVYITGKSNRAIFGFEKELDAVLNAVPELLPLNPDPSDNGSEPTELGRVSQ